MTVAELNSLVLAYLGDAVYEAFIRDYLVKKGYPTVKELQEASLSFVSAKSQSSILKKLLEKDFFSSEELAVIKRARNAKSHHKPKNTDVLTYKHATSLEAVIGYLAYTKQEKRLSILLKNIVEV